MAKKPDNTPNKSGQRVLLKGRGKYGMVERIVSTWVWIKWDAENEAPTICHVNELTVVEI